MLMLIEHFRKSKYTALFFVVHFHRSVIVPPARITFDCLWVFCERLISRVIGQPPLNSVPKCQDSTFHSSRIALQVP
jgi:hypothetical protein